MIVAGIGSRKGVSEADVLAAIDAVCAAHGVERAALSALATTAHKSDEPAIRAVAVGLGIKLEIVADEQAAAVETLTRSSLSRDVAGTASVSEAAALIAAGSGAKLLGPRLSHGGATCALAVSKETVQENARDVYTPRFVGLNQRGSAV
ncbi:cobalamin biosynthesis protein [Tianweitania sp. Rool2]|uniref:Cobalamin biosynthesis protein n=2 Tax=Oryzicola mucosus TaxID=2767425 RepID=A0A8J6U4P9_9HYPH|nr:cobalamin biosynthesis protein [Oryzicola mucosus]MBD0414805.1 cobalamin biosynthesis protein [Oryzicola mucosus]